MPRTKKEPVDILDEIERLGVRRRTRTLRRSSIELHPMAGTAFTLWSKVPRLLPKNALLTRRASRFLLRQLPMPVVRKGKNSWYALGGFDVYYELQALESPDASIKIYAQEFLSPSDEHVEALSLMFLLDSLEKHCVDGAATLELVRRQVKTTFRQTTQAAVVSAPVSSQRKFADAIGIKVGRLKRAATDLKRPESMPSNFLKKILAEN